MADLSKVRSIYVAAMQSACDDVIALCAKLDQLNNLYTGAGLSGTFLDAELAADVTQKHMLAVDVGTFTANLQTVRAAVTGPILGNMAKATGKPV